MLSPMAATILAVGSLKIARDFHLTSIYTPNLPVAMYVLGLGLGPLCWGPLSEIHGRRVVYLVSFSLFTILNVGCALAPGIVALSVLRFLSRTCGSAGPTLGGASIVFFLQSISSSTLKASPPPSRGGRGGDFVFFFPSFPQFYFPFTSSHLSRN